MSARMKSLGLDRLSLDERVVLAHELLESVAAESKPGSFLTEEKMRELDRRLAEDDADPDGGIPWEQVRDEITARLKRIRP
jgi:putative addiction module component (TIGR02574 family)